MRYSIDGWRRYAILALRAVVVKVATRLTQRKCLPSGFAEHWYPRKTPWVRAAGP